MKPGPEGLRPDDPGIVRLSRFADAEPKQTLLVCCGDVPGVGSAATRVCSDVRESIGARHRCVFERSPSRPDPLGESSFALALAWPRPHLGKDFTHLTFARAGMHLARGGALRVAARTQKGAKTLARDVESLFGNVRVLDRGGGWRVFEAVRDENFDDAIASGWTNASYEIDDPRVGTLRSAPGVFSRRALDRGTATIIDAAPLLLPAEGSPRRVLDLGAGVGPLTVWAAMRWPNTRVVAVEPNTIASALLQRNVEDRGVSSRVDVLERAGPPDASECHPIDLVLSNPPTHADKDTLARMLTPLPTLLSERGRALFVVSRPGGLVAALRRVGAECTVVDAEAYAIVHASFAGS